MPIQSPSQVILLLAAHATGLGAAMHNAAYQALGLNFLYLPISTQDPDGSLRGIRALGIRGASVTFPHKEIVMQWLDEVDSDAKKIGAVNTVINNDGVLIGSNTDWTGAIQALRETMPVEKRSVAVIGTGGAARAIMYGLVQNQAQVSIYGRSAQKVRDIAREFSVNAGGSIDDVAGSTSPEILINATSVGFQSSESIVPAAALKPGMVVMDIVHTPRETALVQSARAEGCTVITGERMLLHQAAIQFELFTGQPAPLRVMETALAQALNP